MDPKLAISIELDFADEIWVYEGSFRGLMLTDIVANYIQWIDGRSKMVWI